MTTLSDEAISKLEMIGIEKRNICKKDCSDVIAPPSELVVLHRQIGNIGCEMISGGKKRLPVIREISAYYKENFMDDRGYSVSNVRLMIIFSEICNRNEYLKDLLMKLTWSTIVLILYRSKGDEDIEKWAKECIKYGYSRNALCKLMMVEDA